MSTTTLTRLSGLALMAAFALALTGGILHPVMAAIVMQPPRSPNLSSRRRTC
jgi:hypothetical protein